MNKEKSVKRAREAKRVEDGIIAKSNRSQSRGKKLLEARDARQLFTQPREDSGAGLSPDSCTVRWHLRRLSTWFAHRRVVV